MRALFFIISSLLFVSFFSLEAVIRFHDASDTICKVRKHNQNLIVYSRSYDKDGPTIFTVTIADGSDLMSLPEVRSYSCSAEDELLVSDSGAYFVIKEQDKIFLGSINYEDLYFLSNQVTSVLIDEKKNRILLGCSDGMLRLYSLDGEYIYEYDSGDNSPVRAIALSRNDRYCAMVKSDYIACMRCDKKDFFRVVYTMGICKRSDGDLIDDWSVCFSSDERFMFAYSQGLAIWDLEGQSLEPSVFFAKPFCGRLLLNTCTGRVLNNFIARSYSLSLGDNGNASFVITNPLAFIKQEQKKMYFMYGEQEKVQDTYFLNDADIKKYCDEKDIITVHDEHLYKYEHAVYERPYVMLNRAKNVVVTVHKRLNCLRFWSLSGEYLAEVIFPGDSSSFLSSMRDIAFSDDDLYLMVCDATKALLYDVVISCNEETGLVNNITIS